MLDLSKRHPVGACACDGVMIDTRKRAFGVKVRHARKAVPCALSYIVICSAQLLCNGTQSSTRKSWVRVDLIMADTERIVTEKKEP